MDESYNLLKLNQERGRLLPNVFEVVNGGWMPCAAYTDGDIQNAFYEGDTGNIEITNLFVFNLKGELIHAAINFLRSWHDSKVFESAELLHDRPLDENTAVGYAIREDSAFVSQAGVLHGETIRRRKHTTRAMFHCLQCQLQQMRF